MVKLLFFNKKFLHCIMPVFCNENGIDKECDEPHNDQLTILKYLHYICYGIIFSGKHHVGKKRVLFQDHNVQCRYIAGNKHVWSASFTILYFR